MRLKEAVKIIRTIDEQRQALNKIGEVLELAEGFEQEIKELERRRDSLETAIAAPAVDLPNDAPAADHEESIAPTDTPSAAPKENVARRLHPPLPRDKGNMEKGNVNTNEIKCYLSLDKMTKIIADEVARRLEPERLLGEYTKETTVFDDGRVEVRFSTANSAGISSGG